jgi:hypothetical protein
MRHTERLGWPLHPADQLFMETIRAWIPAALDNAAYGAAAAAREAMSYDAALAAIRPQPGSAA